MDHFMRMGNEKKKLLEMQEGKTKRWEVGRRDGKNKKKVEKGESEKEDIKVGY
jgi:hypothetical protein